MIPVYALTRATAWTTQAGSSSQTLAGLNP